MRLAVMQPYLFPYIGYFQLINSVDKFVVYDDVNYIKQGWINRNRILIKGKEHIFTLHLKEASSFKLINEIEILDNKSKILHTIKQAYNKAPYFSKTFSLLEDIFSFHDCNLGKFVANSIIKTCNYLDIRASILISSEINKNNELKGEKKVIDICKILGADHYINAIGGVDLYSKENFASNEIKLSFLKSKPFKYDQLDNSFIPGLSIIDVIMFNSCEEIKNILNLYELL